MGIREYGYTIGEGKTGKRNQITDVPNVKVGHYTVDTDKNKTGVTVIIPCAGNIYKKKPVAGCYALNGFGKTVGTIQLDECGVLETPIALTNTLNVGKVADALVTYTDIVCRNEGVKIVSVNPVVGETNDGRINDITKRVIDTPHVIHAIQNASSDFDEGDIGAGKGTVCFGLKGGIGSASRLVDFGKKEYVVGVLVQSNFGRLHDFTLCGEAKGKKICETLKNMEEEEKGSIMVVAATNIPLSERQLKRMLKRAAIGMVKTGSYLGHGSGDIFLGFTNRNFMPDRLEHELNIIKCFPENHMDKVFRAMAEATEEAILNSMIYANKVIGKNGKVFHSLKEFL